MTDLKRAVEDALTLLADQPGIREVEVFAAANRALLTRLNYTSHIPCNGVEEPKSTEMRGLGLHVSVTKDVKGTLVWAADEVVYAPEIAVSGVHVDAIAGFMEGLD